MPLQGSGAISISQIRTELINVNASYSLRTLSSAAGKSTPDAMSEFYGYSACPPNGTFYTSFCQNNPNSGLAHDLYYTYHNGSCGYYNTFIESQSQSCGYLPDGSICSSTCTSGGDLCIQESAYGGCYPWAAGPYYCYGPHGDASNPSANQILFDTCYTLVQAYCFYYGNYRIHQYTNNITNNTFYRYITDYSCP